MRRCFTAAVACLGLLSGCADLPTASRAPGLLSPATDELSEEELAGLELLPLELLTIDPAFPGGYHWYNYLAYQQLGITFEGGRFEEVFDLEATLPSGYRWYPQSDFPQPFYPFETKRWHELRFTPELGGRIRRVELEFNYFGAYPWWPNRNNLTIVCVDQAGQEIGRQTLAAESDYSVAQAVSIVGRNFARCRSEAAYPNSSSIVGMRLTLIPEQTTKIALRCLGNLGENRVTRAEVLRCEVRKDPATDPGDLVVSGWSFNGSERTDGEVTALVWEGQMVTAGTVAVRARIGTGPEQTASAVIEVLERTWSAPTVTVAEIPNGSDSRLSLPEGVDAAKDLGVANFFFTERPEDLPHDPMGEVRGGPNNGLYYFKDLSSPIWAYYVLNRTAMRAGSAFYNAQDPAGDRPVRRGQLNFCDKAVVAESLLGLVEAHEREHIRVYTEAFSRELYVVMPDLEAMVDTDFVAMQDMYDEQRGRIDVLARTESEEIHLLSGNPNEVLPSDAQGNCALKNESGDTLR